ncbi:lactococcin 972 family bacteriocin [Plantibacter sp. YIM 135249]|uniref:lactococcin 972 family bacteriocin n=1 Tax=Plantibacter sp. YIM 135249 TaxID=3423918 RepID=UPI003D3287B8
MKFKNKALAGVLLAGVLSVGALAVAAPANATNVNVEGGNWDYGVAGYPGTTWSNYLHPSKTHRATACNSSFCDRSPDARGGVRAYSSVAASINGNAAYYYNY